jgi:hypothetical protein
MLSVKLANPSMLQPHSINVLYTWHTCGPVDTQSRPQNNSITVTITFPPTHMKHYISNMPSVLNRPRSRSPRRHNATRSRASRASGLHTSYLEYQEKTGASVRNINIVRHGRHFIVVLVHERCDDILDGHHSHETVAIENRDVANLSFLHQLHRFHHICTEPKALCPWDV